MSNDGAYLRSEQRLIITIVALIFGPVFMAGPLVLGIWIMIGMNYAPETFVFLLLMLCGSIFFAHHMTQNYHWVELDGDVIRGRRFWTRQFVERNIAEISEIVPLGAIAKTPETQIADAMFGPNRGYEIRFKNGGRKIVLVRGDMTNVQELADVLISRIPVDSTAI